MAVLSKRGFFKSVGYEPHAGQLPMHAAFEDKDTKYVACVCGTRFGKSKSAAHEAAWEAVKPREKTKINPDGEAMIWIVAPIYKQTSIVFNMVAGILRKFLKGHIEVNKTEMEIRGTTLSGTPFVVMGRTTTDAAGKGKLTGYAVDFIVFDEAATEQDPDVWENQLSTRLLDRRGRALLISSPRGNKGFFANMYRIGKSGRDPRIKGFQFKSEVNPYLSREEIEYYRKRLPRRAFQQEFEAELLADSGLVFDEAQLKPLFCCEWERPIPGAQYFASFDIAISRDWSVLLIARAPMPGEKLQVPRIVRMDRYYKMPIQQQLARLKAQLDSYGEVVCNVDHNGMGQPIFQLMCNIGILARPIYTTGQGATSKFNLIVNASAIVDRQAMLFPRIDIAPILWDEMTSYQWEKTESGRYVTANAPTGEHDDTVSSFLMLCWHIRAAGTEGVAQGWRPGMEIPKVDLALPEPEAEALKDFLDSPDWKVEGLADPDHHSNAGLVHNPEAPRKRAAPSGAIAQAVAGLSKAWKFKLFKR